MREPRRNQPRRATARFAFLPEHEATSRSSLRLALPMKICLAFAQSRVFNSKQNLSISVKLRLLKEFLPSSDRTHRFQNASCFYTTSLKTSPEKRPIRSMPPQQKSE